MSEREQMLPCPFCGGDPVIKALPTTPEMLAATGKPMTYQPLCAFCDAGMRNAWYNEKDAISAWNRRFTTGEGDSNG
jgi:hypothetical protein